MKAKAKAEVKAKAKRKTSLPKDDTLIMRVGDDAAAGVVKALTAQGRAIVFLSTDPYEQKQMFYAADAFGVINEFRNWLRSELKHGDPNKKYSTPDEALDTARKHLYDIIAEHELPDEVVT
jgi:hypothetical protein